LSVLLVDIGNTRIKWATWRDGRLGNQQARDHAGWSQRDFERGVFGARSAELNRILVASVGGQRLNRSFSAAALRMARLRPEFAASSRSAAGVTTRYVEPWRLGVDRFAAVIGAHHRVRGRAACVVNAGTTLTIDLVDGRGVHRGGVILPGRELMVDSLFRNTDGIQRRAQGDAAGRGLFARSTRAAIERGASYASAALIDRAVREARGVLPTAPVVLLTGGAARRLAPLIRSRHVHVPDLVLRGLAVYSGLRLDSP
jgi:type III pantothenate kinase